MNKQFRRLALKKILTNFGISETNIAPRSQEVKGKMSLAEGPLTKFVEKTINQQKEKETTDFKSEFLKLKAGPEREKLVFDEIIKRRPINRLIPITVPGPGGTKITYKVMPDYITIDGIRIPMSGKTAQKVANHFGMSLPTSKMTQQIWEAADTKIRPTPLSGGGKIGDRYFSGEEVVRSKISDSDSALAYSQMIEDQLKDKKYDLVAGHMKTIIMTDQPDKLGLYGWSGDSKSFNPIQHGEVTPHDTTIHTEYGTGVRLIADEVEVTLPNGKTITTTMDQVLNHSIMHKAVSNKKVKKYKV